jgi:hypothetical protein
MKYIKTINDYDIVNEELDISWRQLLIGIGIMCTLRYYLKDHKITTKETDKIIYDISNKPTTKEGVLITKFKQNLIDDILSTNQLDSIKKDLIVSKIKEIRFVCVDTETMEFIGGEKGVMACYMRHFDERGNKVKAIIVDKQRLNSLGSEQVVNHELRHLVDDIMRDSNSSLPYSEFTNIVDILDKDIVLQNDKGKKKLQSKIDFYSKQLVEIAIKNKISDIKNPEGKKTAIDAVDSFRDQFQSMFDDKHTTDYLTSPAEVYVRFHGLKRWMIQNGYLMDMNDVITQEKIIQILSDTKIITTANKYNLDFVELLFYLDVDFTGKEPHDFKKVNSIVANYTDYLNKPTV